MLILILAHAICYGKKSIKHDNVLNLLLNANQMQPMHTLDYPNVVNMMEFTGSVLNTLLVHFDLIPPPSRSFVSPEQFLMLN